MKKTKLLIPIVAISTLGTSVSILTGCSCNPSVTQYTVKFDTQGGSTIADVKVNKDSTIKQPANPTKVGFTFSGWYTDKECSAGKEFDFNTKITSDLTLYAKWVTTDPTDLANLKKINKILGSGAVQNTMAGAVALVKQGGIDIETLAVETAGGQYVWDQKAKRFIIYNITTEKVIYAPDGYTFSGHKWELWIMVGDKSFNEYSEYSQYLKTSASNALTKTTYSFISGFDCGENEDVKSVHYFYEKMDTQTAKDIIINTCSKKTNVDVSAWDGNGTAGTGDTVTHYGQMCELTVVSNDKYVENGKAISATVYDGEIKIDANANIAMTYVRDADVTLTDYKTEGTIDEIYTDSSDANIKTAIESQGYTVESDHDVADTKYQEIKESVLPEVTHVFEITNGTNTIYFESLTKLQQYSNDTETTHTSDEPDRFFTGWTITLNKDYDMALEGGSTWKPICATIDTGKKKYEYSKNAVQKGFAGIFDGRGHSIVNMNLGTEETPLTDEIALFGGVNGTIKNLKLVDCAVNVKCTDWTSEEVIRQSGGGLLAVALGTTAEDSGVVTIENVHIVNSKLNCQYKSGLFAPYVQYCNELVVKDCSADEDTVLNSTYDSSTTQPGETGAANGWFGHFAYYCKKTTLTNCINYASITGINSSSGFVGLFGSNAYDLTMENCQNYGKISVTAYPKNNGPIAGGLLGSINQTSGSAITTIKLKNCINEGTIDAPCSPTLAGSQWRIGGLVGYIDDGAIAGSTFEFENCTNNGQVGSEEMVTKAPNQAMGGGFVGSCLSSSGKLVLTFKSCTQAGYLCGVTVGHFVREKSTGSYTCDENCTITGSIRQGATRITIEGEPE